ncbi:MAG: family 16 glycosylhydrolase [bacterium]
MKRITYYLCCVIGLLNFSLVNAQDVQDDFEGSGTISSWFGDNCDMNTSFANPFMSGDNTSATVLRYHDIGGTFANVRFDAAPNFDLTTKNSFSLQIYVPSSGITGAQPNQVSLKLQDGTLAEPWTTQSEIIKPIVLDTWQTVTFNFETDSYINLDPTSPPPITRTDFSRVVIQVNGEGNNDQVLAFLDDVLYFEPTSDDPVYDELVWSDEFDGTGNVDTNNWHHQIIPIINGVDWANNELQHYTDRPVNSYIEDGKLVIKALKETYTFNSTKEYTSARLNSKFAFTHGRVDVRAKLPSVAGTWPAIWLLGKNISETGAYWQTQGFGNTPWPLCGEIDIMEPNIEKTLILATWHWDSNDGMGYQINSDNIAVSASETTGDFHVYSLEWSPTEMRIYYDNVLVNQMMTVTPFNNEFFILLNLAMGGNLGGTVDPAFTDDVFEIDYVRVYQESTLSEEEILASKSVLYPNPVQDSLQIKFERPTTQMVRVELYDVNGRILKNSMLAIDGQTLNYDASRLTNGLFFMRIIFDDDTSEVFKFVKQ